MLSAGVVCGLGLYGLALIVEEIYTDIGAQKVYFHALRLCKRRTGTANQRSSDLYRHRPDGQIFMLPSRRTLHDPFFRVAAGDPIA